MDTYVIAFDRNDPLLSALARVLKQRIEARWDTAVRFGTPADLTLAFTEGERFGEIRREGNAYSLYGTKAPHLWDAAGRLLRSAPAGGTFRPAPATGIFRPLKELCGMYFATHFYNFYHAAPLEEVKTYIEDLMLWGMEVLAVWFDMHHYTGMDDPAAVEMVTRLKAIRNYASSLGLELMDSILANEGFSTTPEELKATNAVQNGYKLKPDGFYHVEICPNKQGGLEKILQNRAEYLDVFADCEPEYFRIWPYDQGGCTCAACAPWGSRGFLKTAKAVAELIKQRLPKTKIILSTWYFGIFYPGDAEWDGLYDAFARGEVEYADYLNADFPADYPRYPLTHPNPRPVLSFNEISMYGAAPWGGYGANPMPEHVAEQWNDAGQHLEGGTPYSEGIFEDLNKAGILRLFRDGQEPEATIREYLRYECAFPEDALDDGVALIRMLETGLFRDAFGFQTREQKVKLWHPEQAQAAEELADRLNGRLPPVGQNALRWRQILLRARIDGELVRGDGEISDRVCEMCAELDRMYHTQNGSRAVRPYCKEALTAQAERLAARPDWKGAPVKWWLQSK